MQRIHPHVKSVMDEMGQEDPELAVRAKARTVIRDFVQMFDGGPPFDLLTVASFRGLVPSAERPRHSLDSEIAPEGGQVVLRVNADRPLVRQRFSIGHEIGHTLFPEYRMAVRCRKPANREHVDTNDQLEWLCDVAASEILFPSPWFDDVVGGMEITAANVASLASRFVASPEATIRRWMELVDAPIAVVACSWKLKPTEIRGRLVDQHQSRMFGVESSGPAVKLRVDYAVLNRRFEARFSGHVPKDKSVPFEDAILHAATSQMPCDGDMWLDLGTVSGRFRVHVLPTYTPSDRVGPGGACSVIVIIRPS